jgi:hypothetical protein
VLGLLALFTHIHAFWVAGLLLALIDLPDIGWPLRRMAGSLERIAGIEPGEGAVEASDKASPGSVPAETSAGTAPAEPASEVPKIIAPSRMPPKERSHA